jgi:hypothetical protein
MMLSTSTVLLLVAVVPETSAVSCGGIGDDALTCADCVLKMNGGTTVPPEGFFSMCNGDCMLSGVACVPKAAPVLMDATAIATTVATTNVTTAPGTVTVADRSTVTPYDSSSGSSNSLGFLLSSSGSLNADSSVSSSSLPGHSSGESSGSNASGSSGSYLQIWQWVFLLFLCMCCLAGGGGAAAGVFTKKKPKKATKKKNSAPMPVPPPVDAALPIVEEQVPLVPTTVEQIPLAAPVSTTSQYYYTSAPAAVPAVSTSYAMPPSYAMPVAAPVATSYAAPVTTSYAAPSQVV